MRKSVPFLFLLSIAVLASGCSKEEPKTNFATLKQTTLQDATKPEGAIAMDVTMEKSKLLGRSFMYSSSLQFSSIVEDDISTALMGISLGQVPANFRVMGEKLQLVTDGRINFESDVNHPSRLIYEFKILSQSQKHITFRIDEPSPISDTFLFGNKNKVALRYNFLRSFEMVEDDELFLIESTVELTDGSIGEFMESLRPRDRVIPEGVKPIYADSDLNPLNDRYGFLDAGDVYVDQEDGTRVKTKAATRAVLNGKPMEWYITGNVPDAYINDVKNSVEAWNRYSRAAKTPDLVKFMGKLPDGIKVGDPRFNLIVWDKVQEAGAAYESQNSDPLTGVQTHSMIYIPLAWINIGKDYWNKMSPDSQEPGEMRAARLTKLLKSRSFLGRALPVHCMDNADMHVSEAAKESPEQFARGLLKGVVFHEMGHALGLAHNFKGSLVYDSDDAKKPFTTSIMDYNHYNEEDGAFTNLESSDGPLLEYDRQIISVLYNEGKDVKDDDLELPACDDSVADSNEGGVDPLCVRYDIGADITKEALKALDLFTKAGSKRGKQVAITPQKVIDSLIALPPAAKVEDLDQLKAALGKGLASVSGTVSIYISASANSFGYLGSQTMKSLKVFKQNVLPDGYNESEMRERALTVLHSAAAMHEFPALTKEAYAAVKPKLLEYLASTALLSALPRDAQEKVMVALTKAVDKALGDVEMAILSRMRTRFITATASTPTAPLAFIEKDGNVIDIEADVMGVLEKLAGSKAGTLARPAAERLAALKSLKTYSRSESYKAISDRVISGLGLEIHAATDPMKREVARKLLAEFKKDETAE